MNNEEKNLSAENEAVEENNNPTPVAPEKKLSGGVIGAIIGGVAAVIAVIVLLVTLLGGNNNQGGGDNNPPTDTKVTYTVTVVDQDGNAIKSAYVEFINKGSSVFAQKSDDNGKVTYKSDKELTAKVTSIPAGYEYDKLNQVQSFDEDGNLTVTINKLAPFVILVIDQNGDAVPGVKVQMCDEAGSCRLPKTTDEEGKGYYNYEEGTFHAQLTNGLDALPEGYTCDNPTEYHNFVDGVATIVVTKLAE